MNKGLIAGVVLLLTPAGLPPAELEAQTSSPTDVVLRAADSAVVSGAWTVKADPSASQGAALWLPDAGVAKLASPAASPRDYFEKTFTARAGVPYRLWIRSRAQNDSWSNDSVFVQFSGSVDASGTPAFRIGSTSATTVSLEDCNGCGVSGWGWSDNGYGAGVLGPLIYFAADGSQIVRVQGREDGFIADEVVLSPQKYLQSAPGANKQDTTILPPSDGTPAPTPAVTLVRGPYLKQPTDRSTIVVWATRESGLAEVRYDTPGGERTSPATSRLVAKAATGLAYDYYHHEATVTGLSASTAYGYQPFVGGIAAAPKASLTTAPAPGTGAISFVALGDSGTGSLEQRQLAALIDREQAAFAMHVGDIAYGSPDGTGDASYATYQSYLFDVYKWLPSLPFVPVEGNHDSRSTNGDGKAYLDLFVLPESERYYSFDYGPVHFIALDTEYAFQDTSRRATQLAWLETDLAGTRQPWKIAFYHRAPYSSGGEHGSDLAVRAAFGPLFERYGVDLAITGHEHDYERTVPIRESTTSTDRAVTYVVTGGGGAPLYPAASSTWTAFSASRHEYLKVTVSGCTLTMTAVGLDGGVFDNGTVSHCAPPPPPPSGSSDEIVLHVASTGVPAGAWVEKVDATAAGGSYLVHPDASAPKVSSAAASPANYFDVTFDAVAGVPYHLWVRGRAQNDYWGNDSIYVQFSGSVTASGAPVWRIGSSSATTVVLEDCSGCPESGWGWQDNAYGPGVFGEAVYFSTTGPQRVRVQTREDGYGIDQIVLSRVRYASSSPGALRNDTTILPPSK